MYPGHAFRSFCDTAPVLEREHAERAGIGWIGKNTLVIDPALGSYVLLGGVMTTLDVRVPSSQKVVSDHCGSCTRCIDACPTAAITPYKVDASRCISTLTIEHRSVIDERCHASMGDWVFGCDVCQEVCPHNGPTRRGGALVRDEYAPAVTGFNLLEVLGWSEDDRRRAFTRSAMKRVKLFAFKRNAAIAATNAALSGRAHRRCCCGVAGF